MDKLENCADCGKKFGFTERIFSKTNGLWICEDCAITQMQENDNKDQKIADLEAKLEEYEKFMRDNEWNSIEEMQETLNKCEKKYYDIQQQLAEKDDNLHQIYSRLGVEAFGEDIHEQALKELAEKEKVIENLRIDLKDWQDLEEKLGTKYDKVVEQLAEKEKEIKQLKLNLGMFKSTNEFINRYGIEKAREVLLQSEKTRNQTAIAELEKVKTRLNQEIDNASVLLDPVEYEDYHELLGVIRGYKLSVETIDQQIKSLKGETDGSTN